MIQQFHFGCISNRIESRASKRYLYTYVCKVNTIRNVKCLVRTEREPGNEVKTGHGESLPWALVPPGLVMGGGRSQSSLPGLCPLIDVTKTRNGLTCHS